MSTLEAVRIDVRDVDHEWFRDVAVFYDRDGDRYRFPRESAERQEKSTRVGDSNLSGPREVT